ncbi:MAG: hypothetical protein IJ188_06550 [Clostridia bacterium]|nr:hypothetical protein [Clostridia bacterium]
MNNIAKVHCLFEQSGTFKREFRKMGIPAEDYDILDDFGETDRKVDLFDEIDRAYDGRESLFDGIGKEDLVMAFFPCTRFETQIMLSFRSERHGMGTRTAEWKLENAMTLHQELHDMYMRICKLFMVCLRGGWRMVVENPRSQPHYLTMYFPIRPKVIDPDRRVNGDYYKKATQYWFVNCKPESNVIFEALIPVDQGTIKHAERLGIARNRKVSRSMMHWQYARRFIAMYIIDRETCEKNVGIEKDGDADAGTGYLWDSMLHE